MAWQSGVVVDDGTNSLIALGEGASGWTHHLFDNDDERDVGDSDDDDSYGGGGGDLT